MEVSASDSPYIGHSHQQSNEICWCLKHSISGKILHSVIQILALIHQWFCLQRLSLSEGTAVVWCIGLELNGSEDTKLYCCSTNVQSVVRSHFHLKKQSSAHFWWGLCHGGIPIQHQKESCTLEVNYDKRQFQLSCYVNTVIKLLNNIAWTHTL